MAEESRMPPHSGEPRLTGGTPPPPPPPRSSKPIPPPPPGRSPMPPPPPGGQSGPMPMGSPVPPAMNRPAPAPIPFPPGGAPVGPPMGAMPGMPAANKPVDSRLQDMERRFQEQEEARRKLEEKTRELENKLKDEHEKLIVQSLKAKEEESLSVRVDQQLREMQEKLRREKYEQELQESRGKAENQLKDLERRIGEERETWMTALKNQLKEREAVEREVEQNLTRRLHDFEGKYQEEKNQWTLSLKQKEEDLNQERRRFELEMEKMKEALDDRDELVERAKQASTQEMRSTEARFQADLRTLQAQLESQMRETGSWKAQIALLQSQLQQEETQVVQDRKRMENQLRDREQELKREFSQRDHERTQYWEGVAAQLRAEKEAMRSAAIRQEEEESRMRLELVELKRRGEIEHGEWQAMIEKAKRMAREDALRELPTVFEERLDKERKRLTEEKLHAVQALQLQLSKLGDTHKVVLSKYEVEQKRWTQQHAAMSETIQQLDDEKAQLNGELQQLKADVEKQTKELFHHIAEAQMKEANTREEFTQLLEAGRLEKEKLEAAMAVSLQEAYAKEEQIRRNEESVEQLQLQGKHTEQELAQLLTKSKAAEAELVQLRSQCSELTRMRDELQAKEALWKTSQTQLTTAFHNVQNELVKLQNEHTQRDAEWSKRESEWTKKETDWQNQKSDLEKAKNEAPAPAPMVVSAEAQKALSAIKQQMQELRTIFAGMRPAA